MEGLAQHRMPLFVMAVDRCTLFTLDNTSTNIHRKHVPLPKKLDEHDMIVIACWHRHSKAIPTCRSKAAG